MVSIQQHKTVWIIRDQNPTSDDVVSCILPDAP